MTQKTPFESQNIQINVQQIFAGIVVNFLPVEDQTVDMFSFSIVAFTSFSSSQDSGAGL